MQSAMIDIPLLRVFQSLVRRGSVTAAARELGVSQSTASYSLACLRRHYGDPLFIRAGSRLIPTPLAATLVDDIDRILLDLERIQAPVDAFDPTISRRKFRIHMIDLAEVLLLPRLLMACEGEAAYVRFDIMRGNAFAIRQELDNGSLDLAIGTPWEAEKSLHRARLLEQKVVGVARPGHPLSAELGTVQGFLRCRHCVIKASGPIQSDIDHAIAALPHPRQVALEVPGVLAVPEIVANSDLIAVVPEGLLRLSRPKLQVFAPPIRTSSFVVMQHWPARLQKDPGHQWLRRLLRRVVQNEATERAG